jgi:hypothetical protein
MQYQALQEKPWSYISTILPQDKTHLVKQKTTVVGVIVNLRMVTTIVTVGSST